MHALFVFTFFVVVVHSSPFPSVQLGCNHIGDEGVKALAIALISNARDSGLVWLALGGNDITDRGAEHLAVALKAQHSGIGGGGGKDDIGETQ